MVVSEDEAAQLLGSGISILVVAKFTTQVTSATPLRVSLELEVAIAVPGPNEAMRRSPADWDHWSVSKLAGHPEMGLGHSLASCLSVTGRRLDGQVFGQVTVDASTGSNEFASVASPE